MMSLEKEDEMKTLPADNVRVVIRVFVVFFLRFLKTGDRRLIGQRQCISSLLLKAGIRGRVLCGV